MDTGSIAFCPVSVMFSCNILMFPTARMSPVCCSMPFVCMLHCLHPRYGGSFPFGTVKFELEPILSWCVFTKSLGSAAGCHVKGCIASLGHCSTEGLCLSQIPSPQSRASASKGVNAGCGWTWNNLFVIITNLFFYLLDLCCSPVSVLLPASVSHCFMSRGEFGLKSPFWIRMWILPSVVIFVVSESGETKGCEFFQSCNVVHRCFRA